MSIFKWIKSLFKDDEIEMTKMENQYLNEENERLRKNEELHSKYSAINIELLKAKEDGFDDILQKIQALKKRNRELESKFSGLKSDLSISENNLYEAQRTLEKFKEIVYHCVNDKSKDYETCVYKLFVILFPTVRW